MITIGYEEQLVSVKVFGEFTLADYKEFEDSINYRVKFQGVVNLLFDLREMAEFTLDVAWEEIKFSRAHAHDFGRIAVLTESQWMAWSAWLAQVFVDAELRVFDTEALARDWLAGEEV